MAKKKAAERKVTKAQAIREALKKYRRLMPKQIAEKLSATGLNVTANEVSIYKYQMKTKKGARKAAKAGAPAAVTVPVAVPAAGDMISMTALEAAKKLVKELGGVARAKRAINSLARLVD